MHFSTIIYSHVDSGRKRDENRSNEFFNSFFQGYQNLQKIQR